MGEHRRETKRMQKNDVVKAAVTTKAAQMAEIQGHKARGCWGTGGLPSSTSLQTICQRILHHVVWRHAHMPWYGVSGLLCLQLRLCLQHSSTLGAAAQSNAPTAASCVS